MMSSSSPPNPLLYPPDQQQQYQPPPVATVEVPLRQHARSVGNTPPHHQFNTTLYNDNSNNSSNFNPGRTGDPPTHLASSYYAPGSAPPSHLFNGIATSNDHRTQYSGSTRSTGSGGGNGGGNNILQIAFPTAEFAIQQQLFIEQQQYAQQYADQMQHFQQPQHLPPLAVVSLPTHPVAPVVTQAAPIVHGPPPQPPALPESSPWTLGSTDGSVALSMLLQEFKQQPNGTSSGGGGPIDINELSAKLLLEQKRSVGFSSPDLAPPSTAGAAILEDGNANVTDDDEDDNEDLESESPTGFKNRVVTQPPERHPPILNQTKTSNNAQLERNPLLRLSGNTREEAIILLQNKQSLFQEQLFRRASVTSSVEACLAAACEVLNFDIAEMWLRTGPKTHQLTNSHLRPTALEDSVRKDLVDVYYGEQSSERTHRLSPALCKRAKEAGDVVWVTAHNPTSAEALRCSISNVRTAVAIPVCHEASNTNITILFFSIRRVIVRPASVEFLVHMSLAAGVASICSISDGSDRNGHDKKISVSGGQKDRFHLTSRSEHAGASNRSLTIRPQPMDTVSITGARLDLQWRQLTNVEYLTDGGNSWIHTAVYQGKPVVVKTLKPECQDVAVAINEIEGELSIHSRLDHPNIVSLLGAGLTSKGVRFFVLERLDGGTLTQMLGYETRIRDRRRRFWRKKLFSFLDVLRIARSIAEAMAYCHEQAVPGSIVLHRDLKPDNIGFTLDGTVKLMDFGLAKILENATVDSDAVYTMSGETGSLRYMAPEVADGLPYNYTADVYSFGIILWELNSGKKPYEGLNRELFYERIVHGGERPPMSRKWPTELTSLMSECWDADMRNRPKFHEIVERLDVLLMKEKGGGRIRSPGVPAQATVTEPKTKKFCRN